MSLPQLALGRQLCFLVYRLDRELTARYRPLLAPLGLTYPQYLLMLVLWEADGRSVGEICAALHLDTGTVSPLLKRLEAQGLVSRTRRADDERAVEIRLTAAGRDLEAKAAAVPFDLAACSRLELEEYEILHAALTRRLAAMSN
jgi:DNA-binding MarR family transcriptional regulator